MRKARHLVGVLVCLCPLVASPATAESPLYATTSAGLLTLRVDGGGAARLELADGRRLQVPLPESARLEALAAVDDGWIAAGSRRDESGRRRLLLLAGGADRVRILPTPGGDPAAVVRSPVLLTDGGELAGVAWLAGAGDDSLAVRAAPWTGEGLGPVERVSAPGPGSQLALAGTVLADGSWLLVWTAYDGHDDELVWSRRLGGGWLPVARLGPDNDTPDIVPAVTAAGTGALVAWSRYDGAGYRLRLARFSGGQWQRGRTVGERGSLYPSFESGAEGPLVVYRTAAPATWSVLELDDAGEVLARASLPVDSAERPALVAETEGVSLTWPDGRRRYLPLERKPGGPR